MCFVWAIDPLTSTTTTTIRRVSDGYKPTEGGVAGQHQRGRRGCAEPKLQPLPMPLSLPMPVPVPVRVPVRVCVPVCACVRVCSSVSAGKGLFVYSSGVSCSVLR